jgi:ferredoxin
VLESVIRAGAHQPEPIELIEFVSKGRCLIIGQVEEVSRVLPRLEALRCYVALIDEAPIDAADNVTVMRSNITTLSGWLGAFQAEIAGQSLAVDLVLDLSDKPIIDTPVAPLGYFAPQDAQQLAEALQQLPDLIGEFDKPRYFDYQANICAHNRRGVTACTNCIDACPAEAIQPSGAEMIQVNPNLCQGCGSCTAVCPSGAMRYALPSLDTSINRLRNMLDVYQEAQTKPAHLLIHDLQLAPALMDAYQDRFADSVVAFDIEEIGALGMPFWLTAIAYGVSDVVVWDAGSHSDHDWQPLQNEMAQTNAMLSALGYGDSRLQFVALNTVDSVLAVFADYQTIHTPARYAGIDDKRRMTTLALTYLHQYAPMPVKEISLDITTAFGEIQVDKQACTLCMSCVSVCPMGALVDGVDKPQLNFIEDLCVQCGMCDQACPENAISLKPVYRFDRDEARQKRILNEEAVFHCVSCQKPFATQKMIDTMMEKLKDHPMFQGDAIERLKLCEDCRVKAMFK